MISEFHELRDVWEGPIDKGYYGYGADFFIDFDQSPEIKGLYRQIKSEPSLFAGKNKDFLFSLKDLVRSVFPRTDYWEVIKIGNRIRWEKQELIISLDEFVKLRKGFCAHAAVTTAVLLEKLIQEESLKGKVLLDAFGFQIEDLVVNGHQWAVFVTDKEKKYVIDPTFNFVGTEREYEPVKERIMESLVYDLE